MKHRGLVFGVILILAAVFSGQAGADPLGLRINCTIHSSYEAFFFRLVEEICGQNAIAIEHNTPPVGRSLIHVNEGVDDADGPRVKGLTATYPNLIIVPEPFGEFVFGAFIRDERIRMDGWSGLEGLNIAYIHGWKFFDNNVPQKAVITKVKNAELLFKLLDVNRTDAVLITRSAGYDMIKKLGLNDIWFAEPPLAVKPNFLYLNKRHEKLAPVLAKTLKALKANGRYAEIYAEFFSPTDMDKK